MVFFPPPGALEYCIGENMRAGRVMGFHIAFGAVKNRCGKKKWRGSWTPGCFKQGLCTDLAFQNNEITQIF
jgi:hypothetical protein